jgi:aromatic-L-amino-acid decarboxylase
LNGDIVADIQESGISAPSTTELDGRLAIRAAIVNHRTDVGDIDALVSAVLDFGARRSSGNLIPGAERSRTPTG